MEVLPATAASSATFYHLFDELCCVQKLCFWRWWRCHVGGHLGHHRSLTGALTAAVSDSESTCCLSCANTASPQAHSIESDLS